MWNGNDGMVSKARTNNTRTASERAITLIRSDLLLSLFGVQVDGQADSATESHLHHACKPAWKGNGASVRSVLRTHEQWSAPNLLSLLPLICVFVSLLVVSALCSGEMNMEAIARVESLDRELGLHCQFARVPHATWTSTAAVLPLVQKEADLCKELGMPCEFLTGEQVTQDLPASIKPLGAVLFNNQAKFNPVAYCRGLAVSNSTRERGDERNLFC